MPRLMRDFGASPVSGGFDTNLNVGRVAPTWVGSPRGSGRRSPVALSHGVLPIETSARSAKYTPPPPPMPSFSLSNSHVFP